MKKIPYVDLNVDLFEEILPSKLKLLVIPNEDKQFKIGLYVAKGSYNSSEKILNTKIFTAISKLLSMVLKNTPEGNIDDILLEKNAYLNVVCKESYTYYEITGYDENYEDYIDEILKMTTNFIQTEENVEKTKQLFYKEYEAYFNNPINAIIDDTKKCLYTDSLIKEGVYGNYDDIKSIHLNTLKKFFNQYYQINNMTLFISGHLDPVKVSSYLTRLKLLNTFKKEEETPIKQNEQYSSVKQTSLNKEVKGLESSLVSIGIKMMPRQELYEQYGADFVSFYEILGDFLFSRANPVIQSLLEKRVIKEVVDVSMYEASEDACLIAVFKTDYPSETKKAFYDYISDLEKKFDKKFFDSTITNYYGKSIMTIGDTNSFMLKLVDVYANHMAYPSLILATNNLKKKSFSKFVKDLSVQPNSVVVYKSND